MQKTALNQERWRRVEELYHAALDQEPGQRSDFLDQACQADQDLRREVDSLLAADSSEALIDQSAMDVVAELLDESPLAAGTQLGPYRIEGLLGSGGMGRVYRARDTRLGRTVALKISKEEFGKRFEQEARLVATLNHPNICQLYDVGPNYLVMELVEGEPIKGPLALAKVVEYSGQILDALDTAHRKGIVHRDLKPANILVAKQGIKLLDFGLAKQQVAPASHEATITQGLTGAGMILGTLQYMSPEQLQSKPADARSDLFCFGCVLYEMVTGKRAFKGENPASLIAAILEREPAPLEVSPPLDRVVIRCLAKDPDLRFQTAIDLKTALIWAVEQQPVTKPATRWRMGAAALALGLACVWALFQFRRPATDQRVIRFQIQSPTGARHVPGSFSVSPDGFYVTYMAFVEGKRLLWLHALDGSVERLLTDNPTASFPFWSPDSKSIGWAADSKLWRVDLSGGAPVVICEQKPRRPATWTPDGRILFGSLRGVMQVAASGGSAATLTAVDLSLGEVQHGRPELLPNGRFLHWVQNSKPGNSGIYAVSISNPAQRVRLMASEHQVRFAPAPDGRNYLLTLVDRSLVAQEFDIDKVRLVGEQHRIAEIGTLGPVLSVEVSRAGILLYTKNRRTSKPGRLIWFDRAGRPLSTLSEPGAYDFSISPDGRHVAMVRFAGGGRANIWMLDTERRMLSRFTSSAGIPGSPIWSPNGQTVVFSNNGLFRKNISGSGDEEAVTEPGRMRDPTDWSRDGRFILFSESNLETNQDLWALPVTSDGKPLEGGRPRPYLHTPFNEGSGRFSPEPNPHWVAYQSDETGRYEIFIASFPDPRRRLQITNGGGAFPQWGADGRELFYITPDNKLMSVGLKIGPGGIEPSTPRELFPLGLVLSAGVYAVAPDGKRILANQIEPDLTQLEVIVNWPALLKR